MEQPSHAAREPVRDRRSGLGDAPHISLRAAPCQLFTPGTCPNLCLGTLEVRDLRASMSNPAASESLAECLESPSKTNGHAKREAGEWRAPWPARGGTRLAPATLNAPVAGTTLARFIAGVEPMASMRDIA